MQRLRNKRGDVIAVRLGGGEYRSEARLAAEMEKRYGGGRGGRARA